jgi:hypothetical protein
MIFKEAGKARKGLSSSDIAKLGDTFVNNDAKVAEGYQTLVPKPPRERVRDEVVGPCA